MQAQYETLSPKALKLLRVTAVIQTVLLALVLGTPLFFLLESYMNPLPAACICLLAAAALCLLLCFIVAPLRFRRYRYLIAQDRVEIIEGLLFVRRKIVPVDRIHQIDILRGPLDTLTGVAKVVVTTAGSQSAFRFLEPERAETLALYLNDTIRRKLRAANQNAAPSGENGGSGNV